VCIIFCILNNISTENPLYYVRSKCFASTKKEVCTQWFLLTKTVPVTIMKVHNCDTTNFPWVVVVVGGGIRELEYLIIYYEKKHFFLISTKSHTYVHCGTGA
jgi:hypothetical protein